MFHMMVFSYLLMPVPVYTYSLHFINLLLTYYIILYLTKVEDRRSPEHLLDAIGQEKTPFNGVFHPPVPEDVLSSYMGCSAHAFHRSRWKVHPLLRGCKEEEIGFHRNRWKKC